MTLPLLTVAGALFIGAFEGFEPSCYNDAGGNCTVGYGHLVAYHNCTDVERRRWGTLTKPQAARLLCADARTAALGVERHITVRLTKYQYDALISFAYNCGPEALAGSVGAAVNSKPRLPWPRNIGPLKRWHDRIEAALLQWDHVGGVVVEGLLLRRRAEAHLERTGQYTRKQGNAYAHE